MDELLQTLVGLEESLFTDAVRKSRSALDELIHDEFEEVTSSGKAIKKDDAIDWLSQETAYEISASDYEVRLLSEALALLKYKSKSSDTTHVDRYAIRSSIWKFENDTWKMLFHQGTTIHVDK